MAGFLLIIPVGRDMITLILPDGFVPGGSGWFEGAPLRVFQVFVPDKWWLGCRDRTERTGGRRHV